jgi:N-acetylneuraminic acid mutarotase
VQPTLGDAPQVFMHSAVLLGSQMYVFGGLNEAQQSCAALFALQCQDWTWAFLGDFVVDGTEVRVCGHTACASDEQILVFGGLDPAAGTIYNQMFVYYTREKHWGRVEQPKAPRFCGGIARVNGNVLLFGGCNLFTRVVPKTEVIPESSLVVDLLE